MSASIVREYVQTAIDRPRYGECSQTDNRWQTMYTALVTWERDYITRAIDFGHWITTTIETLQQLYLGNNRLCDVGIYSLALSINSSILKRFGLESNLITDEGARYLAEMLRRNRTLIHLNPINWVIEDWSCCPRHSVMIRRVSKNHRTK